MGQDLNALYLSIGKALVGSTWPASGLSDAALINKGAAAYAANPAIVKFPNDWTAPIPPNFVVANPGTGVTAPNAGQPITTTKDTTGKTVAAYGQIPGTSVVFNSPA